MQFRIKDNFEQIMSNRVNLQFRNLNSANFYSSPLCGLFCIFDFSVTRSLYIVEPNTGDLTMKRLDRPHRNSDNVNFIVQYDTSGNSFPYVAVINCNGMSLKIDIDSFNLKRIVNLFHQFFLLEINTATRSVAADIIYEFIDLKRQGIVKDHRIIEQVEDNEDDKSQLSLFVA